MADFDDAIEIYERAVSGDEDAQATLWHELRPRMLRVIRLKAADLQMEWMVEADGIYDLFLVELFNRGKPIRFIDACHLTCYIEKSLRRRTARAFTSQGGMRFQSIPIVAECDVAESDGMEHVIRRDELQVKLSILPRRERVIFELFSAGYRWREIGIRLGLTADTARIAFRRAIARIRDKHSDVNESESPGAAIDRKPRLTSE